MPDGIGYDGFTQGNAFAPASAAPFVNALAAPTGGIFDPMNQMLVARQALELEQQRAQALQQKEEQKEAQGKISHLKRNTLLAEKWGLDIPQEDLVDLKAEDLKDLRPAKKGYSVKMESLYNPQTQQTERTAITLDETGAEVGRKVLGLTAPKTPASISVAQPSIADKTVAELFARDVLKKEAPSWWEVWKDEDEVGDATARLISEANTIRQQEGARGNVVSMQEALQRTPTAVNAKLVGQATAQPDGQYEVNGGIVVVEDGKIVGTL